MKKFYLLTKTLLVAVCLLVGASNAWGDVVETYPFATWVKAAGSDQKNFTFSSAASAIVNNVNCYTYTSALNGNSLGDRFAVSNTHKGSGLLDQVWFRLRNNSETDKYTGLFVGDSRSTYFAILNLVQGDKVTIIFNNNPDGNKFYSSNATYDNSGTPTAIVSGTTKPESGKEYTITSDGHLGLYMTSYSAIKTVSITRNITSYTTRMATAKSSGSSLSSSVMRTSVKSSLTSALSSEYVDMASSSITSSNIDAYITALEALETAVSNAQSSAENFAILNDLITRANTFAETVTSYEAPEGAEDVYTSDADVDPVALAAAVRAEVIEEGVKNDDTDITAIIVNSSFELGSTLGWTTVASDDTGARRNDNATYTTTGTDGEYLFNTWSKGTPITQTIGTLPAGQYRLSCLVASNGGTIYLTMNDSHNGTLTTGDGSSFEDAEYTFTLASDTEVTIGAVGGDGDGNYTAEGHWWYKADKFTLTYVGQDPLAIAKASLEAEIETATALKDSWTPKVGTAPFKYDATYYNALVTQITSSTTVLNSGSETVSDYTSAESALETAEGNMASSTQNQPDADKYYRLYLANGGTSTGKNLNLLKGSTYWLSISDTPYPVKFVASGSYYTIRDAYGNYIGAGTNNYDWGTMSSGEKSNSAKWECTTQDDGTVIFYNQNTNYKSWGWRLGTKALTDNSQVACYYSDKSTPSNVKWLVSDAIEVTDVNLAVNATTAWGTFIAPYDNLTPSTVKAYTVSHKEDGSIYFAENETGVLSANTPYILSTEEVSNVSVAFKGIANNDENTYEVNGLVGLLAAETVPANSYILQYQAGKVGTAFYKLASAMTGTKYRCYLDLENVPVINNARTATRMSIFGGVTGVENVEAAEAISKKNGAYLENGKIAIYKNGMKFNANGQLIK